ncbi:MAG: hypothetical protein FJX40_14310 [Alphaproteobacteria bacterium]|nr:hypothetical protein [Alphaproteobacteria bacterium]
MAWYVVEAFEGKDFEAQLRLAAASLNVWRPVHRIEVERHIRVGGYDRRTKVSRNVARFGRYIFLEVDMTDAIYQAVKHTSGVFGFLTLAGSDAPAEIDSRHIAFLKEPPLISEKALFHSRDRVRIKAGPFADHEGVIEKVDKRGVPIVTIQLFGGATFPIDACYLELLVRRQDRPKDKRDKRRTRRLSVAHS